MKLEETPLGKIIALEAIKQKGANARFEIEQMNEQLEIGILTETRLSNFTTGFITWSETFDPCMFSAIHRIFRTLSKGINRLKLNWLPIPIRHPGYTMKAGIELTRIYKNSADYAELGDKKKSDEALLEIKELLKQTPITKERLEQLTLTMGNSQCMRGILSVKNTSMEEIEIKAILKTQNWEKRMEISRKWKHI